MITDLKNKFKDRDPKDTVEKIQSFFKNTIFDLVEEQFILSESGTYSCRYELFYNGRSFLGQNGKGTTKEFAQASGLAELYERFCNYYLINCANPLFSNLYQQTNKELNGYYFSKDEKKLTKKEIYDMIYIGDINEKSNCFVSKWI